MTEGATSRHLGHVARGGAVGLAGSIVNAVSALALVLLLARGLDPASAGRFFAASSLVLVLVAVAGLGTNTGLSRFMLRYEAEGRADDVVRVLRVAATPVLLLALTLSAVVVAAAGPLAALLGWGDGTLLRTLGVALPFAVVTELALAGTQALGRMRTTALVDRMLRAGLQALLAGVVLAAGGGVVAVAVAWTAAWVVAALLAVRSLVVFVRQRLAAMPGGVGAAAPTEGRPPVAREFWVYTRWRGVARVAQVGIQRADVVLVAVLLGPAEAAVYTAATRFVLLGQFVTQALQQVLQPRFTAILIEDDPDVLRDVFRTGTAWSIVLAWPVYLAIGCAPAVYLSVFGEGYGGQGAQAVVLLMTAAMLVAVAAGAVDTLLVMAGRSALSTGNTVAALVVDIVGCLVLLPVLGIAGAAVAWGAAVLLRNGLAVVQVRRDPGVSAGGPAVFVALLLPPTLVGLPVAVVSLLLDGSLLAWLVSVVISGLAYLLVLHRCRRLLRLDLLVAALARPRPGRNPSHEHPSTTDDEPPAPASPGAGGALASSPGRRLGTPHG